MPSIANKPAEESATANSRAYKGAAVGAGQWGLLALCLGAIGHFISPVYRGLTPQFKLYIQLSAMTCGGVIGAERSVRTYEFEMVREKRRRRNEAVSERYEGIVNRERGLERKDKD